MFAEEGRDVDIDGLVFVGAGSGVGEFGFADLVFDWPGGFGFHRLVESALDHRMVELGLAIASFVGVLDGGEDGRIALGSGLAFGEATGHEGNRDSITHFVIHGVPHKDAGFVRIGDLGDVAHDIVEFAEAEIAGGGDVDEESLGSGQVGIHERAVDGGFGGAAGALFALGDTQTEGGATGIGHDAAHVGEIHVDEAGTEDDVADAAHALLEDGVGELEGVFEADFALGDFEQFLVGDDDEGVYFTRQTVEAFFGEFAAHGAFEIERLADDGDGEDAELAGEARDDGSGSGASTTAHAGGEEHHVGAFEEGLDFAFGFDGGGFAELGVTADAEATGGVFADDAHVVGLAVVKGLTVGIERDEFDAGFVVGDPVDGVAASAADAHHTDDGARLEEVDGAHEFFWSMAKPAGLVKGRDGGAQTKAPGPDRLVGHFIHTLSTLAGKPDV